ncbi:mitochondrial inner membrane protein required for protein import [Elasticomyces elasticus]|uniref:Mitochondrial import inner membrane translocase subunit TIM50 n=1 Tax=Elasticomyces elasticus TaxID=574655 RepID=A0AAN7WPL0_9PEZI|nr:mitochondrial inner membrane protein required for protein import [Elasticomyces elasticus]
MLLRLALRAVRSPHARLTPIATRTYASSDRPRKPPPPPPRPAPPARPRPADNLPSASGQVRQTSPGTSINDTKDQTWKAGDGIKFAASAQTSIDGTRPADPSVQQSPLSGSNGAAKEPIAQREHVDQPVEGGLREKAFEEQARSENTVDKDAAPAQPQQPLPDLRQGLPSTFDMEFGSGKMKSTRPSSQDEGVDVSSTTPRTNQSRGDSEAGGEGEGRSYDRSAYETSLDRRRAQMANYLYTAILFTALTGGFYLSRPFSARDEVPSGLSPEDAEGWSPGKLWTRMQARLGHQVGYYTEPTFPKLLPEIPAEQRQPYTLVLSLEDLLIHSTWSRDHGYQVAKRPGVDYFLRYLSQYYELVLFTSVPLSIADPVIKKLDPYHFIMWPLGREATKYESGTYVKDLSYLNRDLSKTVIVDTVAGHVRNQPENAVILPKWTGDVRDPEAGGLVRMIPFLENLAAMGSEDVRPVLKSFEGKDIATEFARREQAAREELARQNAADAGRRPRRSLGGLGKALGLGGAAQGGMVLADGQSVTAGYAAGKTLSDQIREQGQKQYEAIEKQIREHGAEWLKEEEEEQKKAIEAQMKDMKKGAMSFGGLFGGGSK